MKKVSDVAITGIQRNYPQGEKEACDEMVNLRFRKGAWRPIGQKEQLYDDPVYRPIRIHKEDTIENWIGYKVSNRKVYYYNPSSGAIIQTVLTLNLTETLNAFQFLKRYLLVITNENLYVFLFKDTTYVQIELTGIESRFTTTAIIDNGIAPVVFDSATDAEGLLGKYYLGLNTLSGDSRYIGGIFYRVVIRLYDGTEILHTLPTFFQFYNYGGTLTRSGSNYFFTFNGAASISATQSFSELLDVGLYDNLKDIIDSVVIYACQNRQFYDISEDTITDTDLTTWLPGDGVVNLEDILGVADTFKDDMYDSVTWWKIGEVQFSNLEQSAAPFDYLYTKAIEFDMEDFYTNYATRRVVQIDNFTHHELTGNASYVYNDRLILGDTVQTLAQPWQMASAILPATTNPIALIVGTSSDGILSTYEADIVYESLVQVKLDTTNGYKVVELTGSMYGYKSLADSNDKAIFFPALIGYYDSRAIEIIIHIVIGGTEYELYRSNMKKSTYGNFAYAINDAVDPEFYESITSDPRRVDYNFVSTPMFFRIGELSGSTPLVEDDSVLDNNRRQISTVNNPFVFPAENSDQIGVGIILAFGTNTEAQGVSQFGQYPLYTFTSVGIWASEIGTGSVYILNNVPLSGEVLRDKDGKLDLSFGIAYISSEGLRIVAGKEVIELSETVEGLQDRNISDNLDFLYFIDKTELVELTAQVDKIPFTTYLESAFIGYNKANDDNELIVANASYDYCYLYDLKHKYWTKIGSKYTQFIPNYPELYANDDGLSKIVNVSSEINGSVQCLFLTRAISFDAPDYFKKLRRTFLRCFLNGSAAKYPAFYIFVSDDLEEWTYLTGNDLNTGAFKDIWVTHTHHSSRYVIFLFTGNLNNTAGLENRINKLQSEIELKRQDKLR